MTVDAELMAFLPEPFVGIVDDRANRSKNKDTLDSFADALIKIPDEAKTQPDLLHNAQNNTQFGTIVDEVKAARVMLPKVLVA